MPLDSLLPTMALQFRRDLTVSVVGFTSWAAVAWKVSRGEGVQNAGPGAAPEALLALVSARRRLQRVPYGTRTLHSCSICRACASFQDPHSP